MLQKSRKLQKIKKISEGCFKNPENFRKSKKFQKDASKIQKILENPRHFQKDTSKIQRMTTPQNFQGKHFRKINPPDW